MKKIISLVIAAMMAVSMFAVTVPAMAANVSSPTAATLEEGKAQTTVNGETRQGVTYSRLRSRLLSLITVKALSRAGQITFQHSVLLKAQIIQRF